MIPICVKHMRASWTLIYRAQARDLLKDIGQNWCETAQVVAADYIVTSKIGTENRILVTFAFAHSVPESFQLSALGSTHPFSSASL